MTIKTRLPLAAGALIAALATQAGAAVTEFGDFASFSGATGALSSENFDTFATGAFTQGVPIDFGDFTITNDASSTQAVGVYEAATVNLASGTAIGSTRQLAWGEDSTDLGGAGTGDGPTFTFTFDSAVRAFGFDFSDSDPTDAYQVVIDGQTIQLDGASTTFQGYFGFVSDTDFTTVTFSQTTTGGFTEAFSLDNLSYSQLSAATVPLPASGLLLVAGVGLLGLGRRLRG